MHTSPDSGPSTPENRFTMLGVVRSTSTQFSPVSIHAPNKAGEHVVDPLITLATILEQLSLGLDGFPFVGERVIYNLWKNSVSTA